jgi:hypothetical protein
VHARLIYWAEGVKLRTPLRIGSDVCRMIWQFTIAASMGILLLLIVIVGLKSTTLTAPTPGHGRRVRFGRGVVRQIFRF